MSIPEDANELSKNCWSYFDYPVEQSEIEEYVESSDDDYSVKCSVYEFSEEKAGSHQQADCSASGDSG